MQFTIPGVPDKLTYSVAASIAITAVVTILAAASGLVQGGIIALILGGVTYWFVYRNLAANVATSRMTALIVGIVHAFFAIVSISIHVPLYFILDAASAACLFYAFLLLQRQIAA